MDVTRREAEACDCLQGNDNLSDSLLDILHTLLEKVLCQFINHSNYPEPCVALRCVLEFELAVSWFESASALCSEFGVKTSLTVQHL
jgi:hypothetical protein